MKDPVIERRKGVALAMVGAAMMAPLTFSLFPSAGAMAAMAALFVLGWVPLVLGLSKITGAAS